MSLNILHFHKITPSSTVDWTGLHKLCIYSLLFCGALKCQSVEVCWNWGADLQTKTDTQLRWIPKLLVRIQWTQWMNYFIECQLLEIVEPIYQLCRQPFTCHSEYKLPTLLSSQRQYFLWSPNRISLTTPLLVLLTRKFFQFLLYPIHLQKNAPVTRMQL